MVLSQQNSIGYKFWVNIEPMHGAAVELYPLSPIKKKKEPRLMRIAYKCLDTSGKQQEALLAFCCGFRCLACCLALVALLPRYLPSSRGNSAANGPFIQIRDSPRFSTSEPPQGNCSTCRCASHRKIGAENVHLDTQHPILDYEDKINLHIVNVLKDAHLCSLAVRVRHPGQVPSTRTQSNLLLGVFLS